MWTFLFITGRRVVNGMRRVVNGMRRVVRRLRPCCPSGQVDSGNIAMPATYDNGPHEVRVSV